MDRRSTLAAMLGKSQTQQSATSAPVLGGSLNPYTGPWTVREAGHLLRRATFGPSEAQIQDAVNVGLNMTIDRLFTEDIDKPEPPVKWVPDTGRGSVVDPEVAYGDTWVNASLIPRTGNAQQDQQINNYRQQSLYGWMYLLMNQETMSIREKMTIFWHNHFVVSEFRISKMIYQYLSTIHDHVVGDFKQLTKDMTIDPSMLLYLNGAENTSRAPNENFARELLELFTIGKGDLAGPGDYTNYTEEDIKEMAKILTGWTLDIGTFQTNEVGVVFYNFNHDLTTKTLSHRFGNATISPAGSNEYKNLIDVIFEQDEVSRFICRKLYRYFVHYVISDDVERDVIEPMAQILRDNNYNIESALRALLSSEHFYSEEAIGCMIKNPSDFTVSILKGLNVQLVGPPVETYNTGIIMAQMSGEAGMYIYNHPDVAGWKAYYQEPSYYRIWINTVTLPIRAQFSSSFVSGGTIPLGGRVYTIPPIIPVLDIVADVANAQDPNILINTLADSFFPYGITEGQKDYLKEILIPGLPDFEWTVEYSDYLSDPGNPAKRLAVENRLRALFNALLEMPEAQLM